MDLHAEFLVSGIAEDDFAGFRKEAFRNVNADHYPARALPQSLRDGLTRYDDGPRVATPDNKSMPAGYTYFGQIVAHDLSSFLLLGDAVAPSLELRSLYGAGPVLNSYLYWYYPDRGEYTFSGVKFRLEEYTDVKGRVVYDMPRLNFGGNNPTDPRRFNGKRHYPLMGDTRNDQNFILSQLHVAWMQFHNAMAEKVHANRPALDRRALFSETRRLVNLHYQYLIVYDYLKKLVGMARFPLLLSKLGQSSKDEFVLFEATKTPRLMPEFTSAAFRIGHSQVRSKYMLHFDEPRVPLYLPGRRETDLRGFTTRRLRRSLDWRLFFQYPDAREPQMSKALDLHIAKELSALIFESPRDNNLVDRDDRRSIRNTAYGHAYRQAPGAGSADGEHYSLWYHLLEEAELSGFQDDATVFQPGQPLAPRTAPAEPTQNGGQCLGPLGSQIVAEQIFWVLRHSPVSILKGDDWFADSPFRNQLEQQTFTMADLLRFVGYEYPAGS